jgi:preprotein translocase SecE subunit
MFVTSVKNFITETYSEFGRVQWPDRKQGLRLTIYVIGASLIVGLFVSGFDYIFKELLVIVLK